MSYTAAKRFLQKQIFDTKCKKLIGFMGPDFKEYNKLLKKFNNVILYEKDLTLLRQITRNQSNLSVYGMELTGEKAVDLWNNNTGTFFDFDFCGTIISYKKFIKTFFKYKNSRRNHFQFTFTIRGLSVDATIDYFENLGGVYVHGYQYQSNGCTMIVLRSF